MSPRRLVLGGLAIGMLALATVMYVSMWQSGGGASLGGPAGILGRVGLVLLAIFLAWPVLEKQADRIPLFLLGTLLGGILFLAIRPQMGRIIVALVALMFAIHFGLRFLSQRLGRR